MINNNLQEDYCSFEISKLLKEKGFEIITFGTFTEIIPSFPDKITQIQYRNLIPTHALVIKWIRNNFGIHIYVEPVIVENAKSPIKYDWVVLSENFDTEDFDNMPYHTYEQATDAAILFTLQNLIP